TDAIQKVKNYYWKEHKDWIATTYTALTSTRDTIRHFEIIIDKIRKRDERKFIKKSVEDLLKQKESELTTKSESEESESTKSEQSEKTRNTEELKNEDSIEWLKDFNKITEANNWSNVKKLQLIKRFLKGSARNWYEDLPDILNIWNQDEDSGEDEFVFTQLFTEKYITDERKNTWFTKLSKLKQRKIQYQVILINLDEYLGK
ncbi:7038_t:CDS:2, partial [Funneliformis geosporum]